MNIKDFDWEGDDALQKARDRVNQSRDELLEEFLNCGRDETGVTDEVKGERGM